MSRSLGPVIAMTGVVLFNDVIVHNLDIQREMRVVVAGGVVALTLGLVESASPDLGVGLAWLGLITVLLVRTKPTVPAPLESIASWLDAANKRVN